MGGMSHTDDQTNLDTLLTSVNEVLFDVDNTLVGNESHELPSERFQAAAAKAVAKGVSLGLATARPLQKVHHVIEACQMTGLCILNNGAQIYDAKQSRSIEEYIVAPESTGDILKLLQKTGVEHWVNDGGVDHFWVADKAVYAVADDIWQHVDAATTVVLQYIPARPYVIMAHNVTSDERQLLFDKAKRFEAMHVRAITLHETHLPGDGRPVFDIAFVHDQGNKRDALKRVMQLNQTTPAQYMAVGDGHNDVVIVEYVGVGVAVDNAVESVKRIARLHVPAWQDDGAAVALERLLSVKTEAAGGQ